MPRYDDFDYDDIRLDRGRDSGPKPHSGLGLASIGIAALMFFSFLFLFAIAAMTDENNNGPPEKDPVAIIGGLGLIAGMMLTLIGTVLGVVACCQSDRNPLCGFLGAAFNGLILLGVMFVICAGLALGG